MKLITPSAGTAISPIDILKGFTLPVTGSITSFETEFKKFTGKKLTGLPVMSLLKFNYYKWIKGIKVVNILDSYFTKMFVNLFNKKD